MCAETSRRSSTASLLRQLAGRFSDRAVEIGRRAIPEELLHKIAQDPENVMAYFAQEAVSCMGEQAKKRVDQLKSENPGLPARYYIGRLTERACILAGVGGGLTGLGGWAFVVPDILWLLWVQNRLALEIAAVYGKDPLHPDRAKELLVVQGVYNSTAAASAALTQATVKAGTRLSERYLTKGVLQAIKQALRYFGIKFTRTGLVKSLPLVGAPIGFGANYIFTRMLARSAARYYDDSITLGGREELLAMLLTTIRIAKADREINEDERILISALIESSDELSKGDKRSLTKELESPATTALPEEVECFTDPCIRMGIFMRAVEVAVADGDLAGGEKLLLEELRGQLAFSDSEATSLREDLAAMGLSMETVAHLVPEPETAENAFGEGN